MGGLETMEDALKEAELIQKFLPLRPLLDQYEAAAAAIAGADNALAARLEELVKQKRPDGVSQAAFRLLQEAREFVLRIQVQEQKKPWACIIEAEDRHRSFEQLKRRLLVATAQGNGLSNGTAIKSSANGSSGAGSGGGSAFPLDSSSSGELSDEATNAYLGAADHAYADAAPPAAAVSRVYEGLDLASTPRRAAPELVVTSKVSEITSASPSPKSRYYSAPVHPEPISPHDAAADLKTLSTIAEDQAGQCPPRIAAIFQKAAQQGWTSVSIKNMFVGDAPCLPEFLGQLKNLTVLIMTDNKITKLPDSIGELTELTVLDLQSNDLTSLPDTLGQLTKLEVLNIEKNSIEELPYTIRNCEALEELRADFNQLKALPEAIGNLSRLRILTVHLNNLKGLPTTIGYLMELTELDAHFNQIDHLPESLCFLPKLKKLDVSSNFHALKALPYKIGELSELVELDISHNCLSELPDSFVLLTNLQKLRLEGNPWRVPPFAVTEQGKQAVFDFLQEMIKQKQQKNIARRKRTFILKAIYACTGYLRRCSEPNPGDPTLNIRA